MDVRRIPDRCPQPAGTRGNDARNEHPASRSWVINTRSFSSRCSMSSALRMSSHRRKMVVVPRERRSKRLCRFESLTHLGAPVFFPRRWQTAVRSPRSSGSPSVESTVPSLVFQVFAPAKSRIRIGRFNSPVECFGYKASPLQYSALFVTYDYTPISSSCQVGLRV